MGQEQGVARIRFFSGTLNLNGRRRLCPELPY
jgi:hypothetical protein